MGELEGAQARLELEQTPRNALPCKACGERSEDFCAAKRHGSNGVIQAVEKVPSDFFDSLREGMIFIPSHFSVNCYLFLNFAYSQNRA